MVSAGYQTYGSTNGDLSAEWQAGLALEYPLFRPARSHAIDRADAAVTAADQQVRLLQLEIGTAVDQSLRALTEAIARSDALERAVRHLEEVVRIEALALTTGAGVQTDYLRAEAELFETRSALAQTQNGFVFARLNLARIVGELTQDWVLRYLEGSP